MCVTLCGVLLDSRRHLVQVGTFGRIDADSSGEDPLQCGTQLYMFA